jgi:carbonic anhydrase
MQHPRTPLVSRGLFWLAVAYLLLPFDLIPDFIPVLGQLDDLLIIPGLIWLGLQFLPAGLLTSCRQQVMQEMDVENSGT